MHQHGGGAQAKLVEPAGSRDRRVPPPQGQRGGLPNPPVAAAPRSSESGHEASVRTRQAPLTQYGAGQILSAQPPQRSVIQRRLALTPVAAGWRSESVVGRPCACPLEAVTREPLAWA